MSKYPPDLVRVVGSPDPQKDLGDHMPHLGKVLRFYKEKEPNYYDPVVDAYIRSSEQDPAQYTKYRVAPKTLALATKSISRYNKSPTYPSQDAVRTLQIAADWYGREFGPFMFDSPITPFGEVFAWLQTGKSAGYPLTLKYPYKEDYYGCLDGEAFIDYYWQVLPSDDYVKSLCSATVKEEVRPSEKLDQGKVRTTVSMDTNHIVSSASYQLSSFRRLVSTHLMHPSAVGINPFYGGWHRLQNKYMRWFNESGIPDTMALDGVEFDSNFKWCEMEKCAEFDFACLPSRERTQENWLRMKHLAYELVHSPIVNLNGDTYGRECGNPSGQFGTIRHNNQKTYMNISQIWLLACEMRRRLILHGPGPSPHPVESSVYEAMLNRTDLWNREYHTYDEWKKNVLVLLNGDDLNLTVHPSCHAWFNVDVVLHLSPLIGMQYTSESPVFERFVDLPFLGHRFALVDIPGFGHAMYLPTIDCEKMRTNMLIYNHTGTLAGTILRANGLRNETFACESCREWFGGLISYLRNQTLMSTDPTVVDAWKSYKTDVELWQLFTGCVAESVRS